MRRAAPPPMARVDPTDPGPWACVVQTQRGLGLAGAAAPRGAGDGDGRVIRPSRAVPHATHQVAVVNGGALALTASPGIARTYRLPDLATLFDRRPPGLAEVRGAAFANAGLLRADDGWRAAVLPSMGDLASDLGRGPIAIRSDGRSVALVHDGALYEIALPGAETSVVATPGTPTALAYDASGALRCAFGAGVDAPADGTPIAHLAAAASAPRLAALHADGTISLWDEGGSAAASFAAPVDGTRDLGISDDGTLITVAGESAGEPSVGIVRADDGALLRHVVGARAAALMPDGVSVLIGGDWGMMLLEPPREA